MSIFERWRKKKPPQQPEPNPVVEPEQPKTLIGVGWDVVEARGLPPEEMRGLYNVLQREERILLGRGSLFVSEQEFNYFFDVMTQLNKRPVILVDFNDAKKPSEDLRTAIEEYRDKPSAPVVFVKNYFQNKADQIDPRGHFDSWLRGRVQGANWAAIIHGNRFASGAGNIAGSSSSTKAAVEETYSKKKIIEKK